MSILGIILVVVLLLMLLGSFPAYGYNASWGHGPVSVVGVVLIIVLVAIFSGRL